MQGALLCAVVPWRPHPVLVQLEHCTPAALALPPEHALVCRAELALWQAVLTQNHFSWRVKGCWSAGLSPIIVVETNLELCTKILCFLKETLN